MELHFGSVQLLNQKLRPIQIYFVPFSGFSPKTTIRTTKSRETTPTIHSI